jgi:hypothetical protein
MTKMRCSAISTGFPNRYVTAISGVGTSSISIPKGDRHCFGLSMILSARDGDERSGRGQHCSGEGRVAAANFSDEVH